MDRGIGSLPAFGGFPDEEFVMLQSIYDAVVAAHDAGNTRDQTIIALVGDHGLSLNAATKAYATVAKSEGWVTALVSHKDAALDRLAEAYGSDWTAEDVRAAVIDLTDWFSIAESTARDYAKAYSELLGVDHPVIDPRAAMFEWLVTNSATATKAEFIAYAGPNGLGRSVSNVNEYWKGLELHRAILAAS
jgi:hypothetical protein